MLFINRKGEQTMRMNEILHKKGIEVTEEKDWYWMNHPAKDGNPRWGLIRKEMRIYSPSDWKTGQYSIVGITIDTTERTIGVEFLMGTMPNAENLFLALLADRDVRRLIKGYQSKQGTKKFRIWEKEGSSGCTDIFLTTGKKQGWFAITNTKKLCHISQFGRLNEGYGNKENKMDIGEFVELVAFMGLTENMRVQGLRKMAGGVKYIIPKFAEELQDFTTEVSKIL